MNSAKTLPFVFLSIIAIGISSCAKQEYPPGGPEDRTPPKILMATPQPGSVNVAGDTRIRIEFSEAIDRTSVEKSVFISPQTDPAPEINAKRDAIEIIPETRWQPDRTYVITLGTDLKDAHNVNLDQSAIIAFSTGPTIDSGSISGAVYKDDKPTRGVSIALFDVIPDRLTVPIDSVTPEYLTQSGEGGSFAFAYLPPDTFYAVAFEDKNKNRRIDVGREMIGLPFAIAELSADKMAQSQLDMRLHSSDTSVVAFRSVSINSDGLLKLRLSKSLDETDADVLFSTMALTRGDGDAGRVQIDAYMALSPYPAADYVFVVSGLTAGDEYELSLDRAGLYPAIDDSLRLISYTLPVQEKDDKTPPSFLDIYPADKAANIHPESLISIRASEPLDFATLNEAIWMIYGEKDTLRMSVDVNTQFAYTCTPPNVLRYGSEYRWFMIESLVRDRAGNALGDSVRVFTFSTVGLDTLGVMSGNLQFAAHDDSAHAVILSFNPAQGGAAAELRIAPGVSEFRAELLPGYYTVAGFVDRNDNGAYDHGSLIPYRLSEPFTVQSDTVRVRTRFESAGVTVQF